MAEPWYKTPAYDSNKPCTHALIIGTSYYRYLPQNPGDPIPAGVRETLGLEQATTPASSALAFAKWLKNSYINHDTPLGSIRMVLSPSLQEAARDPDLANLPTNVLPATTANVEAALIDWKQDCEKSRDHMGIFYASGHGIQLNKEDGIVLLEDFGDPNKVNVLAGAMDIISIWRGMSSANAAKNQFYFVDACRIKPELFDKYNSAPVGVCLDESENGTAEVAPIFFSATSRGYALAVPTSLTLFCQAMFDSFKLYGVNPPDKNRRWTVTTTSLIKSIKVRVAELAANYGDEQKTIVGGLCNEVVFHVLDKPPEVPLHVSLSPVGAQQYARATLRDGLTTKPVFENVSFAPYIDNVVPGGEYILNINIHTTAPAYNDVISPVAAFPPRCEKEIVL